MRSRRLVLTGISLALLAAAAPSTAAAGVRVAVSYFANRSGDKKLEPLKRGLADMLITDLAASKDVTVVERERLQKLMAELELQKNPYFDKRSAGKLGKGLGAAYLIAGAYLLHQKTLNLEARVVDMESSKVVLSVRQRGPATQLFALQTGLAKKLLTGLGASLTLIGKKKIGARSSKSLKAFRHYSRSLAARDRGDKAGERAALQKALAADPSFAAVKNRLSALEKRVARLERAGGLIVTPQSAVDHLHNARLHQQAGRQSKARSAALAALDKKPRLVEAWQLLVKMQSKVGKAALRGLKLSGTQRMMAEAFLADRRRVLAQRIPAPEPFAKPLRRPSVADQAFAAALLYLRSNRPLPLPTATMGAQLYRALVALRRPALRSASKPMLANASGFLAKVDATFRRSFAGPVKRRLHGYGMASVLTNHSKHRKPRPFWSLSVMLYDWVKGPVTVRLRKQRAHPHWREKATPATYLGFAINAFHRLRPAVRAAIGDPNKLVFRAQWPIRARRSQPPLRVVPFGGAMTFQAEALRCRSASNSLTGNRCSLLMYISKGNLVPGCYALELSYRHKGKAVKLDYPIVWAHELKLQARSPRSRRMRMGWLSKLVHRITPANRPGYAKLPELAGAGRFELLVSVEPVFAENHGPGFHTRRAAWMHKKVPYPLKYLYYDVDTKLLGNKKLPSGDDFAAWQRYRERILRRGKRRPAMPYQAQFLPLPALKPGRHLICIVATRTNGAKSPEPDCRHFSVR